MTLAITISICFMMFMTAALLWVLRAEFDGCVFTFFAIAYTIFATVWSVLGIGAALGFWWGW